MQCPLCFSWMCEAVEVTHQSPNMTRHTSCRFLPSTIASLMTSLLLHSIIVAEADPKPTHLPHSTLPHDIQKIMDAVDTIRHNNPKRHGVKSSTETAVELMDALERELESRRKEFQRKVEQDNARFKDVRNQREKMEKEGNGHPRRGYYGRNARDSSHGSYERRPKNKDYSGERPHARQHPRHREHWDSSEIDHERPQYTNERSHHSKERSQNDEERSYHNKERSHHSKERSQYTNERSYHNKERSHHSKERSHNDEERSYHNKERSHHNKERPQYSGERSYHNKERSQNDKERSHHSKERSYHNKEKAQHYKERSYHNKERSQYNKEMPHHDKERSQQHNKRSELANHEDDKQRSEFPKERLIENNEKYGKEPLSDVRGHEAHPIRHPNHDRGETRPYNDKRAESKRQVSTASTRRRQASRQVSTNQRKAINGAKAYIDRNRQNEHREKRYNRNHPRKSQTHTRRRQQDFQGDQHYNDTGFRSEEAGGRYNRNERSKEYDSSYPPNHPTRSPHTDHDLRDDSHYRHDITRYDRRYHGDTSHEQMRHIEEERHNHQDRPRDSEHEGHNYDRRHDGDQYDRRTRMYDTERERQFEKERTSKNKPDLSKYRTTGPNIEPSRVSSSPSTDYPRPRGHRAYRPRSSKDGDVTRRHDDVTGGVRDVRRRAPDGKSLKQVFGSREDYGRRSGSQEDKQHLTPHKKSSHSNSTSSSSSSPSSSSPSSSSSSSSSSSELPYPTLSKPEHKALIPSQPEELKAATKQFEEGELDLLMGDEGRRRVERYDPDRHGLPEFGYQEQPHAFYNGTHRPCYKCSHSPDKAEVHDDGRKVGWDRCRYAFHHNDATIFGIQVIDCMDNCFIRVDQENNVNRGCYSGEYGVNPEIVGCHKQGANGSVFCFCPGAKCNTANSPVYF